MSANGTLLTKAKARLAAIATYHAPWLGEGGGGGMGGAKRESQLGGAGPPAPRRLAGRRPDASAARRRRSSRRDGGAPSPQCPYLTFDAHTYAAAGSTSAAAITAKNHDTPNRSITPRPSAYTAPNPPKNHGA